MAMAFRVIAKSFCRIVLVLVLVIVIESMCDQNGNPWLFLANALNRFLLAHRPHVQHRHADLFAKFARRIIKLEFAALA